MKTTMIACALVAIAMTGAAGSPQAPTDRQLYDEIVRADRVMFDAFNSRNLDGLMASFSEDLEFFHDKDGRQSFAEVRGGFDRMFKSPEAPRRELVAGSLRVYPIPKFGAMQIGSHRFCHVENGKDDCGIFDFAMVWQQQGTRWRVTRVLSYGH
jgi:ketosteroid isomerase-like protein